MATLSEQSKNSASWSNESKNSSTFNYQLRRGKEPLISDIADKTFNDPIYEGGPDIKDTTFQELQDQTWTLTTKN